MPFSYGRKLSSYKSYLPFTRPDTRLPSAHHTLTHHTSTRVQTPYFGEEKIYDMWFMHEVYSFLPPFPGSSHLHHYTTHIHHYTPPPPPHYTPPPLLPFTSTLHTPHRPVYSFPPSAWLTSIKVEKNSSSFSFHSIPPSLYLINSSLHQKYNQ